MRVIAALFVTIFLGILSAIALPAPKVSASLFDGAKTDACNGVALSSGAGCTDTGGTLNKTLTLALNMFSIVIGVIAVIMVIVAGIKYITSQGESAHVAGAKDTLIYAIVGLVIVAMAQVIVHFVLGRTTPK